MQKVEIPIGEASFPAPYAHALEFNPPAHGTWNIVHIGMNIPDCQQIYVCAVNCMRGVVLTAAEMNRAERFSFVILKEEDLVEGTVEDITIEGTADVIRKLPRRPASVCLFTVCTHRFLGCDINRIYRELEAEFPDIVFIRGYMEPIMQKEGLAPDTRLHVSTSMVLRDDREKKDSAGKRKASLLGSNLKLPDTCDLKRLLDLGNVDLVQIPDLKTFRDFERMGEADLFTAVLPNGRLPVEMTARRLEKQGLYLPMTFSYEEIQRLEEQLLDWTGSDLDRKAWFSEEIGSCEAALEKARKKIGDAPVWIDYVVHPRPLGLARLLLEHGFRVEKVFLNGISGEEKEAFDWLQREAPELVLSATILPMNRVLPRGPKTEEKLLAIGPQAAWFGATGYFINMVEGGELYGFDGIRRLADLMVDAWENEKDTKDLVPRKGLGCESCL